MYVVLWSIDHRDRTGGISGASLRDPGGGRGACGQSVYLGRTPQGTDVPGTDTAKSQTYAFTVLGMCQLYHAIGMRDVQKSVFAMSPRDNLLMVAACIIGFILQFAVTEIPFLIRAFGTSHLSGQEWLLLSVLAAFPLFAHEVIVLFTKN